MRQHLVSRAGWYSAIFLHQMSSDPAETAEVREGDGCETHVALLPLPSHAAIAWAEGETVITMPVVIRTISPRSALVMST
jgi:hypothetical protein